MKRNKILVLVLLITALVMGGCSAIGKASTPQSTPIPTVQGNNSVISQGNLVPKDYAYLSFPVGGHVSDILVNQGDQVTKGQLLASLGDREQYQANIAGIKLEVENAQKALNDLNRNASMVSSNNWLALLDAKQNLIQAEEAWSIVDTDTYQQRIDSANIRVSNAKTALDDAQTELNKYTSLDATNPTRKAAETDLTTAQQDYDDAVHSRDQLIIDRDRAQASLQLAQDQVTKTQSDYDASRQGADSEQLKLAQMNLDTAQAHLAASQATLDSLDLKAPFSGTVVDVNISDSQLVSTGTWAILLADYSEWYVETSDLSEQEVVNISVGQGATITPDALPDLTVQGKVTEISGESHMQAGDVLYTARLLLIQSDPRLRWGMTVEIMFNP
jgi:multidrug resistance efflux pump